jgi:hypothetical protein
MEEGKMKEVIESIIKNHIKSGVIFDTHTIIEYLLQNDTDAYLTNFTGNSTETYHGNIGHIIAQIEDGGLVSRIGESWSLNIRKNFSECACWKKQ